MTRTPSHALPAALLAVGAVGVTTALGAVLARLPRVDVEGHSMLPTLRPGDRLIVVPAAPRPGRLVVLRDPRSPGRLLVKRVSGLSSGTITVLGDNPPASTDSRHFGRVDRAAILGRPLYRHQPADRAGWMWRA